MLWYDAPEFCTGGTSMLCTVVKPYRADLPEDHRLDLKRRLSDRNIPFEWRLEWVEELGWVWWKVSETHCRVKTHKGVVFDLYENRVDLSKADFGL